MADLTRLPGPNADFWDWQLHSACRGLDSDIFYHPDGERGSARERRVSTAKAICAACPVLAQCREHAGEEPAESLAEGVEGQEKQQQERRGDANAKTGAWGGRRG